MRATTSVDIRCQCWVEADNEGERRRCGKPADFVRHEVYEPEPLFVCGDHARMLGQPYEIFDVVDRRQ